ncbi:MAG: fatty acid desaturase family protein [Flavobacteriales bacterium]
MKEHATIKQFKANNSLAFLFLVSPVLFASAGWYLSMTPSLSWNFILGQIFLAIFFFQCFILLHETGHFSYFKAKILNRIFGNIFALLAFIPFSSWVAIHNLHHKWTGYRDKDPTTEGTVSPKFSAPVKFLVNFSWFFFIPLFTVGYRIGNYWNLKKLKKHLPERKLTTIYRNILLQILSYATLFYFFGSWIVLHLLPAYILSLMISDLFILSQHSHIEIPLSKGEKVNPIRFSEQVQYTRSISLFSQLGRYIYFNFNLHESHHAHPILPAYHLDKVQTKMPNTVPFFRYLKDAKKLKGIDFIFSTSKKQIGKDGHIN